MKPNKPVDDDHVTYAYSESKIIYGSAWGDITWLEWCDRERQRINSKDGMRVQIVRVSGLVWLARV